MWFTSYVMASIKVLNVWNFRVLWNIFGFPLLHDSVSLVLDCLFECLLECRCVCDGLSLARSVSRWGISHLGSTTCLVSSRSKSVLSLEFPLVASSDNLLGNSSHVFNNQGCHEHSGIRWCSHQWTWKATWGSLYATLYSLQLTRNVW